MNIIDITEKEQDQALALIHAMINQIKRQKSIIKSLKKQVEKLKEDLKLKSDLAAKNALKGFTPFDRQIGELRSQLREKDETIEILTQRIQVLKADKKQPVIKTVVPEITREMMFQLREENAQLKNENRRLKSTLYSSTHSSLSHK